MNSDPQIYYTLSLPIFLGIMALLSALTWSTHRPHRYLLWQTASYALSSMALTLQVLIYPAATGPLALVITAIYLAAETCLAQAMAQRMGQSIRWRWMAVLSACGLAIMGYYTLVQPNLPTRIFLISLILGAILAHPLPALWRAPKAHAFDKIALALYCGVVVAMVLRPLLLLPAQHSDPTQPLVYNLVWWGVMMGMLVLVSLYAPTLIACALVDTMNHLRRERDHDALTGLLNRRAFQEACGKRPHAQHLNVMVLCDLDHFKRINDTHGHAVGDEVLENFGQLLTSHLRATDVVARIGGEEFALALRHVDTQQAHALIGRLSEQLRHTQWSRSASIGPVTASFGLAAIGPHDTLTQAMERADAQLYQAKDAGRNRMQWAL